MLPLPLVLEEQKYQECCGNMLCYGCIYAAVKADNRALCPFCRTPGFTSDEEELERLKKRAEGNDTRALFNLGCRYNNAEMGLPQDYEEAMELWLRAGELGCAESYCSVANAYYYERGVERDMKKHKYYLELAAMRGDVTARHNLGMFEARDGNADRAAKHYMISAGSGLDQSLEEIRDGFMCGVVTKEGFEKALRAHKESKDAMKSDQREAAAAFFQH
jgi:localization factor PodJL